jgi:hypothetical protein
LKLQMRREGLILAPLAFSAQRTEGSEKFTIQLQREPHGFRFPNWHLCHLGMVLAICKTDYFHTVIYYT